MATYWIVVYFILLVWARRSLVGTYWIFVYFILLVWARRSLVAVYWIFVFMIARLSQAFSCGHLVNIGFPYCSFEPRVLLWPFSEYWFSLLLVWARRSLVATYWIVVYFILLVWARRSLVGTYWIFVYFILLVWARRSLVAVYWIFVFMIARLSQAFSCGHLVNIGFPYCSFEPRVLLWPFSEYLFSLSLVWARRSLVGIYWIFVYFILLVWARRSLVAVYWIFVFLIARLSQAFSCGHL